MAEKNLPATMNIDNGSLNIKLNSRFLTIGMIGIGCLWTFMILKQGYNSIQKARRWELLTYLYPQPYFLTKNAKRSSKQQRFAVIYGAGSKVGQAYAKFLAINGFGLILIDFSLERLKKTEIYLQEKAQVHLNIIMIVIDQSRQSGFDDNKIDQHLQGLSNFCIDCFINACNTYRAKPVSNYNEQSRQASMIQCELIRQLYIKNTETFTMLIQKFHQRMLISPLYASVINVKRKLQRDEQPLPYQITSEDMCKIFYHASSDFNEHFTYLLGKQFQRNIRAITIEIDYDKSDNERYLEKKVNQSFKIINLQI